MQVISIGLGGYRGGYRSSICIVLDHGRQLITVIVIGIAGGLGKYIINPCTNLCQSVSGIISIGIYCCYVTARRIFDGYGLLGPIACLIVFVRRASASRFGDGQ